MPVETDKKFLNLQFAVDAKLCDKVYLDTTNGVARFTFFEKDRVVAAVCMPMQTAVATKDLIDRMIKTTTPDAVPGSTKPN